jgi:hypothetical protein
MPQKMQPRSSIQRTDCRPVDNYLSRGLDQKAGTEDRKCLAPGPDVLSEVARSDPTAASRTVASGEVEGVPSLSGR